MIEERRRRLWRSHQAIADALGIVEVGKRFRARRAQAKLQASRVGLISAAEQASMGGFITRIKGCLEFLRPILPAELNERLERKAILEQGATFIKRNLTFGGFSLSSSRVFLYVRTDDKPAIIHRPADDVEAGGSEIHAGDIKTIVGNGAKTMTVTSRNGDLLLEIEAADEPQRDQWLEGLNEVLLNNFKSTSADKPAGGPKTLKERAEKELYFQKRQMEMNAKRKEAEERKAKLMKEAGGLKYVALAMAERG